MHRGFMIITAVLILFSGLMGCSQKGKSDSPVIATINKATITNDDFIREISRVPEWARNNFKDKEGKEKFLDELIKKELLYEQAKKMRLHKDEEYISKVKEFEKMTLVTLLLKKEIEEKMMFDDSMIKDFYDKNKDKFRIGTQIRASHILVKSEDEALDILEKIKKGNSFANLAKALSIDKTSGEKGGDLGFFGRGKMVPEFEQAVLGLEPGQISDPVRTRFGYHVIKLVDIQKGELANYEQSKESIRRQLVTEKQKALFNSFVEKLKAQSKITTDELALSAIALPWEQGTEEPSAPEEQTETQKLQNQ